MAHEVVSKENNQTPAVVSENTTMSLYDVKHSKPRLLQTAQNYDQK